MGPLNQLKKMFDRSRLIATIVFVVRLPAELDAFIRLLAAYRSAL